MHLSEKISELRWYTPAQISKGKVWFIYFYAFNPEINKLARKRIRVDHVKGNRLSYAKELQKRINIELENGWNPWIDPEVKKGYKRYSELRAHFLKIARKRLDDGILSTETMKDYISYSGNFEKWLHERKLNDIYVYKIDKSIIIKFLEHIYIERGRGATTRNNYLNFLRTFFGFAVENDYLKIKPTEGINPLPKAAKKRTVIENTILDKIFKYLEKSNQYYLLACYFEYYTFIRPTELSKLKCSDINYKNGTIYLPSDITKNGKEAVVTIPEKLGQLLMDLKIYEYPTNMYLFGHGFKPNIKQFSSKQFRDYWGKLRKELKFSDTYQFYSLKDTGITHMLEKTGDPLLVRNQARHHSIAITDIYTPHHIKKANEKVAKLNY